MIHPNTRQIITITGEGNLLYCRRIKVKIQTAIFIHNIKMDPGEKSFIIYKQLATIIPTTTALMPSSARYTVAYFFIFDQIGKKKRTNRALGRKIATEPIIHPRTWV